MTRATDLSRLVASTVPRGVLSAVRMATASHDSSLLARADTVDPLNRLRRYGFATSRHLATTLLAEFGQENYWVEQGEHGAPLWPDGMCGSISYKELWCTVVVAKSPPYSSIGIDIEKMEDIPCNAWEDILSSKELRCISQIADLSEPQFVNLAFSVKEAYFKAQCPITGNPDLDFPDVELSVDSNNHISLSPLPSGMHTIVGLRWSRCWCVASVALQKESVR